MAYVRVGNSPKLDGSPSRWAFKLAAYAASEMVRQRVGNSLLLSEMEDTDRLLLILPRLTRDGAEVVVFYRLKPATDRLREINCDYQNRMTDDLCEFWARYCHGFVRFRITSFGIYRLAIVDHNGTVRATTEIDDIEQLAAPELAALDVAIGTNLVAMNAKWMKLSSDVVATASKAEVSHVHAN